MEQVIFTDEELDEMRKRIIQRAEERIENNLVNELRRDALREVSKRIKELAGRKLEEVINSAFTQERVEKAVIEVINDKSTDHYGESFLKKCLDKAVRDVVEAQGESVGKAFTQLLYNALHGHFTKEEMPSGDGP